MGFYVNINFYVQLKLSYRKSHLMRLCVSRTDSVELISKVPASEICRMETRMETQKMGLKRRCLEGMTERKRGRERSRFALIRYPEVRKVSQSGGKSRNNGATITLF